jgi:hypothetical protein
MTRTDGLVAVFFNWTPDAILAILVHEPDEEMPGCL